MTKQRANTYHIARMLARATATDIDDGRDWYPRALRFATTLAERYPVTIQQAAGVIAALSPRNHWANNKRNAEDVIAAYTTGQNAHKVKVKTFSKMRTKAINILGTTNTHDIARILNGRKITAFYFSILGYPDRVCVDGHAYSVWKGERYSTGKVNISANLYRTIARAYTIVAARSYELCGIQLTPAQVQAVTWTTYRRLHGLEANDE